jgi:hypothetical protein
MASRRLRFDPRGVLAALERNYVDYVLIGGLAQVLRGADQITAGVDICPSFASNNLDRLTRAVEDVDAQRPDGDALELTEEELAAEPVLALSTSAGRLQIIGSPEGAPKGYVDLRRAATKENLGQGLQPLVASVGDLARLAAALDRDRDRERLAQLRQIMELEADRAGALPRPVEPTRGAGRSSARRGRRVTP